MIWTRHMLLVLFMYVTREEEETGFLSFFDSSFSLSLLDGGKERRRDG
jgi:hypothetical protein